MPTKTTRGTPLPRTQDELHARAVHWMERLAAGDGQECRHIAISHALCRATVERMVDGYPLVPLDAVNPETGVRLVEEYPDQVPTQEALLSDVIHQLLPSLTERLRNIRRGMDEIANPGLSKRQLRLKADVLEERRDSARQTLDILSEFAWILGHPETAEQMVPPTGHAEVVGQEPFVAIARFCKAVRIPIRSDPAEHLDMAMAVKTVEGEK